MKRKISIIFFIALFAFGQVLAQTTITVNNADISDNLDLKGIANLFGRAKNLQEFEYMINDPELQISNLDLNVDGYIDYLRVIELDDKGVFIVVIQAVLGDDVYQDVASIDIDTRDRDHIYVQVIGNEYIYGRNYIIEPVYVYQPVIFDFFWYPQHTVWHSPYYWSYYPDYYSYRNPYTVQVYHHHVYENYYDVECRYVQERKIKASASRDQKVYRSDYEKKNPNRSFSQRNNGLENRQELTSRRSSSINSTNDRLPVKVVGSDNKRGQSTGTVPQQNNSSLRNVERGNSTTNEIKSKPQNINNNSERRYVAPENRSVEKVTRTTEQPTNNTYQRSTNSVPVNKTTTNTYQRNETTQPAVKTTQPAARTVPVNNSRPAVQGTSTKDTRSTSTQPNKSKDTESKQLSKPAEKNKSNERR